MATEDPKLQVVFDRLMKGRSGLNVLEVGCGSCSHVDMGDRPRITGIDISEKQLDRNQVLTEKLCGDIASYDLAEGSYDVVICWWILEHLTDPKSALINCQRALKQDGILIIAVPNIRSVKGLITKYTPHSFHIWVYRYILGYKNAGVDDQVPFVTFLRWFLAPGSIRKFAATYKLAIEHFFLYENPNQFYLRERSPLIKLAWVILQGITKILSLGQIDAYETDFIVVLRKTAPVKARSLETVQQG
jgi:SAM-dependent methyltransferase